MADYGEYNGEITKKDQDTIDVKNNSSSNVIKNVIVKNYSKSQIKQGPYVGYVLRVDKGEQGFFSSLFSPQWTAKVRIPELDAHIPEPTGFPKPTEELEIQKIELHRTYVPKGENAQTIPKAGAKVLVEIDDTSNKNFIIDILDKEGATEKPTKSASPKSSHKGTNGSNKGKRYRGGPLDNQTNSDGLTGFRRRKFAQPPDAIVIHESGSDNYKATESVLKNKGCGVHFLATDTKIIQYEGIEHYLIHCPGFNRRSIGIEFNHAYHGKENLLKPARFYWKNKYNIPSVEKLENCYALVHHVCDITGIPFVMPQIILDEKNQKFLFSMKGGVGKGMKSGVVSHVAASPNHGDGNYPCLYFAHRLLENSPQDSWNKCFEIAKVARNWTTHEITPGNGSSEPKKITIEKKMPLTSSERRKYPQYA